MNSSWRETVASSVLILFSTIAFAQSRDGIGRDKLTVSFHNLALENVLEEITKKTGVDFVYSANNINPNKLLSYSAVQQPLDNILFSIGQQLNLSFRWFGDHVVVKNNPAFTQTMSIGDHVKKIIPPAKKADVDVPNFSSDSLFVEASARRTVNHSIDSKLFSFSALSIIEKVNARPKLDSMIRRSLMSQNQNAYKTKPSSWFTSFGFFVNDYTYTGLEFRLGVRSFHGILNASLVNNELSRVGYGIGTFLPSKSKHWSFSLDYTLSKLEKKSDLVINNYYQHIIYKDAIELRSTQHQIKIQAHYALSPNVSLKFGPTINVLSTRYRFMDESIPVTADLFLVTPHDRTLIKLSDYLRAANTIIPPYTIVNSYSSDLFVNRKLWVGFEAGINYRVNISARK
ncbi:MAG TPA: hypothetical protein VFW11_19075 [Cyclobacteriaceae bacterium]|nr:hypothetical protein [Cyclobacteriaceae bacterium]